jgi:hypothetical protein
MPIDQKLVEQVNGRIKPKPKPNPVVEIIPPPSRDVVAAPPPRPKPKIDILAERRREVRAEEEASIHPQERLNREMYWASVEEPVNVIRSSYDPFAMYDHFVPSFHRVKR